MKNDQLTQAIGNRILVGWATPQWLVDYFDMKYGPFQIDVSANHHNSVCEYFFDSERNGLIQDWAPHNCWMNPPYKGIDEWVRKAYLESTRGAKITCLLPGYIDTLWYHDIVLRHAAIIYFFIGRIKYGTAKHVSPVPSFACIFDSTIKERQFKCLDCRKAKKRSKENGFKPIAIPQM